MERAGKLSGLTRSMGGARAGITRPSTGARRAWRRGGRRGMAVFPGIWAVWVVILDGRVWQAVRSVQPTILSVPV